MTCARCGQVHSKCAGHSKTNGGQPCRRDPIRGGTVCPMHGGTARQVKEAGLRRLDAAAAEQALQRGLAAAYGDNVPHVDPADAMLRAVSWKVAEVLALRERVAGLDDDARVWGRTREKVGGEDYGTTLEARPNIWWSMLRAAEDQLVKFAAAARAAGCDERRVQLAEAQGAVVANVLRAIVDAQWQVVDTWLDRLNATVEQREQAAAEWAENLAAAAPRELRRLTDGGDS